jgi:glutamine synthetase
MAMDNASRELTGFLEQHPATRFLDLLAPDINGVLRGKRIERSEFEAPFAGGTNYCGSTTLLSMQGEMPHYVRYGSEDGDPDVRAQAVPGSLSPAPWARQPTAQCLLQLRTMDGKPYPFDPRNVLQRAMRPLTEMGLRVVMAAELEFYLYEHDGTGFAPRMPRMPGSELPQSGVQYASVDDLDDVEGFLADVDRYCAAQGLPAGAALSEYAPGQFEINLHHVEDPVKACDHAVLLKRLIRAAARRLGMGATFMAKPFEQFAGSGLHLHVSLLDRAGNNVFAGHCQDGEFSDTLRHAIGGLATTMNESFAVMAPNANSYRRYAPGFFVPASPSWGLNHRDVAMRLPTATAANTRLEYRVAGADANPYLAAAAVLAGIHHGIEHQSDPGPMVREGESIDYQPTIPLHWPQALDAWRGGEVLPGYFGEEYHRVFERVRREESDKFHAQVSDRDYQWYLRLA